MFRQFDRDGNGRVGSERGSNPDPDPNPHPHPHPNPNPNPNPNPEPDPHPRPKYPKVHKLVGRVNGRFGSLEHAPIVYLDQSVDFVDLCAQG